MNLGRKTCEKIGWHITYTSDHWSNLDSCKAFVEKIYSTLQTQTNRDFWTPHSLLLLFG